MQKLEKVPTKPFLRWAGGKQWLSARLKCLIPDTDYTYYEPFLGGGSLFFTVCPQRAVLGDINTRLIETYKAVRDFPKEVVKILNDWPNESKFYYKIRNNEYSDMVYRAAQLIYLNKSCWNGLYRVNKDGKFNVPFGNNKRAIYNEKHIYQASCVINNTVLKNCDFQELIKPAKRGDFIYIDPPYTVLHSKNGFRRYNEKLFSWDDQERLASVAQELAEQGCIVIVSNAYSRDVINLYPNFAHLKLLRQSVLASDASRRRKTHEALFISPESSFPHGLNDF